MIFIGQALVHANAASVRSVGGGRNFILFIYHRNDSEPTRVATIAPSCIRPNPDAEGEACAACIAIAIVQVSIVVALVAQGNIAVV